MRKLIIAIAMFGFTAGTLSAGGIYDESTQYGDHLSGPITTHNTAYSEEPVAQGGLWDDSVNYGDHRFATDVRSVSPGETAIGDRKGSVWDSADFTL